MAKIQDKIEELYRLGFKAPATMEAPPATTKIRGYYNPNPYQIHVGLSQLNLNVQLTQRGQYITTQDGRKVNDPRLMELVKAGGLAVETGTEEIPVVPVIVKPGASPAGFTGSPKESNVSQVLAANPSGHSVVGMTMAQARKLGLVEDFKPIPETVGAAEGTRSPEQIPELRVPAMKPSKSMGADEVRERGRAMAADLASPMVNDSQRQMVQDIENSATSAADPDNDAVAEALRIAVPAKGLNAEREDFTNTRKLSDGLPVPDLESTPKKKA